MDGFYANFTLMVRLSPRHDIGAGPFVAHPHNYVEQLTTHTSVPRGLRYLLAGLFEMGVIESCSITGGDGLLINIVRRTQDGSELSGEDAFLLLQQGFVHILQPAGDAVLPLRNPDGSGQTDFVAIMSQIIEAVCDGTILANEASKLFGEE